MRVHHVVGFVTKQHEFMKLSMTSCLKVILNFPVNNRVGASILNHLLYQFQRVFPCIFDIVTKMDVLKYIQ